MQPAINPSNVLGGPTFGGNRGITGLGFINVKDFKRDDDMDDTQSIQRAVNAVPLQGGVVFFPAGYYYVSSEILIDLPVGSGGMTFQGAGHHASVLVPTNPTQNVFHVQAFEPVDFIDLGIYTNTIMTAGAGILVEGPVSDVTKSNGSSLYQNLNLANVFNGIVFTNASYWTIDSCRISPMNNGVQIENTSNPDEGDSCISNTVIIQAAASSLYGIYYLSSGGLKLSNVKILEFQVGFYMDIQANKSTGILVIAGNSIENPSDACIRLAVQAGASFHDIVITGNELATGGNYNIDIEGQNVGNVTITGNTIIVAASATAAVQVAGSTAVTMTGNTITGNGSANSALSIAANTQAYIDKSNLMYNVTTQVYNVSTTATIEQYGTSAPGNGTWAIGDRIVNTQPTVLGAAGSQYVVTGWVCTAVGTPGTWSEERSLTGT